MADKDGPTAPFPAPPPFYRNFTKMSIARLRQIRKEAGITTSSNDAANEYDDLKPDVDILSLPTELRYLIPPQPPSDSKYASFGEEMTLDPANPTLAERNVEQLYPSHPSVRFNPQLHLTALARSMLTTFLSLTGILAEIPEHATERTDELQTICLNMHDLINQYRPHQARETLILMMEDRMAQMKTEIRNVDAGKEKIARLLQDLRSNGRALGSQVDGEVTRKFDVLAKPEVQRRKARQRAAWTALEREMG